MPSSKQPSGKQASSKKRVAKENWKPDPDAHDFPAAQDYLSLLFSGSEPAALVAKLQRAETIRRKAKDLVRASALPILPPEDKYVAKDLKKVAAGELLSPVLLVRRDGPLIVADGYHRICASYHLNEDAEIPCRLVDRT